MRSESMRFFSGPDDEGDPESDAMHEDLDAASFFDPTSEAVAPAVKLLWEKATQQFTFQGETGTMLDLFLEKARQDHPDDIDEQVASIVDEMEELAWGAGTWDELTANDIADLAGTIEAQVENILRRERDSSKRQAGPDDESAPDSGAMWDELNNPPQSQSMEGEGYKSSAEVLQAMAGDLEFDVGDGWGLDKDEIATAVRAAPEDTKWWCRDYGDMWLIKGALIQDFSWGRLDSEPGLKALHDWATDITPYDDGTLFDFD